MSAYSSAALRVPRHPHCRRPELSMGRKQASFFWKYLKISAVISSTYATVIGRKKNCVGTVVNITTSARSGLALSQLVLTALIMLCQTFVFLILTEKHNDWRNKQSVTRTCRRHYSIEACRLQSDIKTPSRSASTITAFQISYSTVALLT